VLIRKRVQYEALRVGSGNRLRNWLVRGVFRLAEKRFVHGVPVGIFLPDDGERGVIFPRMVEAFDLLARYDARRLKRFQRDVVGVIVEMSAACGQWESSCGLVRIDIEFVKAKETVALQIATVLVHEGAHAWLDRMGVNYDAGQRWRVEAVCLRSELSFLRRVPSADWLIEHTQHQLAHGAEDYTDAAFLSRRVAKLRQIGVPEPLIRLFLWKTSLRKTQQL
jgi:hypothetical protein